MDAVEKAELGGAVEVTDNVENPNQGVEYQPLFESESVTDEALRGDEDTADKSADAEPKVEDAKEEPEKQDTEQKAEKSPDGAEEKKEAPNEEKPEDKEQAKDEKAEAKDDKQDDKPPPGYVRNEALHQERQLTKNLKAEVARLTAELDKASTEPVEETDEFKDFKILNDAEFDEMLEDDPDAATRYQYKFSRFQAHQRQVQDRQLAEKRATEATNAIIEEAANEIDKILPGIYDKKNETVPQLVDFAAKNGFSPEVVEVLTDPRTRIKTNDGRSIVMGAGAAQLVQFIKNVFDSSSKIPDEVSLRKTIESELRPKIEAEVQEMLMKKLQNDPDTFRSIDQIAGSGKKDSKPQAGVMTESEFARLSPQEQAALLGG